MRTLLISALTMLMVLNSLEPIRNILELYGDDFTPNLNIEWDDMSLETLIAKNGLEAKWIFNILH